MRYITCLIALAIITVVVGVGSATTVDMAGGVTSDTTGTGATIGYAYEFNYAKPDGTSVYLTADINALAYAKGKSSATVTTNVPTTQSLSKRYPSTGNPAAELSVSAKGTTYVKAEGKSNAASVASFAEIHAGVSSDYNDIWGSAAIRSQISDLPFGIPFGKPQGSFYAESSAEGLANYNAKLTLPGQRISEISGSVEGKTTLEGEVTHDHAEIAGTVSDMNAWDPIARSLNTVQWMKFISEDDILRSIDGDGPEGIPIRQRMGEPLIAEIESLSASHGNTVYAGVINAIQVGAINDGIPADTSSYAAGTVEDTSATASGRVQNLRADEEYKVSATKSAKMSADVRVLKALDAAAASSLLATGAFASPYVQTASTIANTYAAAQRVNPGNMADGSDRVWGKAFIASGSWNSWAAELENGALDDQASVSGQLVQKVPESGLGSGAFLQYRKNGPLYANALILQGAGAGIMPADIVDAQIISAELMGPKGHTYGSSGWDGAGVSMVAKNLNVGAYDRETTGPYAPDAISIDIADASGWFWCDGTNDQQYNGLSLGVSDPVFNPTGYGTWTGMQMTYLPSPVQRNTLVTFAATQPA
ncbi:MAG TPA: hypothetical protein PL047_04525 [Methanothrix sp.]|nr:hypothetical protein [Methanothrix sp.]